MINDIKMIVAKWGNQNNHMENYIFPILEPNGTPTDNRKNVHQFTKTTNKWMKRIAVNLGFDINLTTYVARHSFGTVMKRSGASEEFISESYGHASVKTTRIYLDSFESHERNKYAEFLTAFKNQQK